MQASQRVSAFQCHQPPASIALCSWRRRFAVAQGVRTREYPGPKSPESGERRLSWRARIQVNINTEYAEFHGEWN
jgi:hypothetical protein